MQIAQNLAELERRIAAAAARAGRWPQDIKLIAVSKTVPVELIEQAIGAGITAFGESRLQEAVPKVNLLRAKYPQINWHMIGHLQRNKVKQALEVFDLIHSVDSEKLAREIGIRGQGLGIRVPVLVEVNTCGEASKYGVPAEEAVALLKVMAGFDNIQVQGLMTIAPIVTDPGKARPYFTKLR
ncbi:MAG: YggS family pyridoxal phosphate-dependent enzyme, partial [Candidatus Margulisbacteria bacterium]|nr:YggS family pyridoxal phosphate-dependent enzyme [Candidatus Margulisiibacteriota bacterium]